MAGVTPLKSLKMARRLAGVPGVYLPKHVLERMEAADMTENAQEESIRIKTYRQQGIHGIHRMPVGWDEIVPRIITEAGLAPAKIVVPSYAISA